MSAVIKEGDVDYLHSRIDQLEALVHSQGKAMLAQSEAMGKIAEAVINLSGLSSQTSKNVEILVENMEAFQRGLKAVEEVIKVPLM